MMYIDDYIDQKADVNGKWVIARPLNYKCRSFLERIQEAWAVFTGKADAVRFHGDNHD